MQENLPGFMNTIRPSRHLSPAITHTVASRGAAAGTWTVLLSDLEDSLSDDEIAFTAHTFSNAQVEVKDDAATDSIRIHVLSPGSHHQSDATAMSMPGSPASSGSPKKGPKASRPANAFILY
ncbi:hypothetical protein KCU66_g16485, partial [Aureobasidium melanogenum]